MFPTITLHEAARQYGLNDLSAPALVDDYALLGDLAYVETTWGDTEPQLYDYGVISVHTTTGFSLSVSLRIAGYDFIEISLIELRSPGNEALLSVEGSFQFWGDDLGMALTPEYLYSYGTTFTGNSANNIVEAYSGDHVIDGGAGRDTVAYDGNSDAYRVERTGSTITVFGAYGIDTVLNVERLLFDDYCIAYDIDGNAGQAFRLYEAAFNRRPDQAGLGFQISALDAGWGLVDIAKDFINSPEFQMTYGSLSDTQFVNALYWNVLDRPGEAQGVAYHVNELGHGTSRAQILANFSESPENQLALIGVMEGGIVFVPG